MSERIPEMLAVMTPFPYTIDVRAGISEARAMMAENDIRHLAVTEERRLIGIVSQRDLDAAQTPARVGIPSFSERRDHLRATLLPTVDLLHRRRADLIGDGMIADYVALHWLEWNGGALRLTVTGQNICDQIKAETR